MERLNLRHLRISIILFIVAFSSVHQTLSQTLELLNSTTLKKSPVVASIDRTGYLFLAYEDGDIHKLDQENKVLYTYSPTQRFSNTIIEAWFGLKVFIYSSAYQEYYFLDRFLNNSERYSTSIDGKATFNGLATIENENTLWVLNTEGQSLQKIDLINREVIFKNQLNLSLEYEELSPTFIRAYQNLIFISDKDSGILIFDNFGSYLDTIEMSGVSFFSFSKNEIVIPRLNKVAFIDIYSKQKREIETDLSFDFVFMENNQLLGIANKELKRFIFSR